MRWLTGVAMVTTIHSTVWVCNQLRNDVKYYQQRLGEVAEWLKATVC